jgi:RNA polymerase sigma factor for flagellar operon FliA
MAQEPKSISMEEWKLYKQSPTMEMRDHIITTYMGLVRYVCTRIKVTESFEELISYGNFGLIDAVEKYDPERGWRFETYAARRIHGAVIDGLRSTDWVPRSVRSATKKVHRASDDLHLQLQRTPLQSEIRERSEVANLLPQRVLPEIEVVDVWEGREDRSGDDPEINHEIGLTRVLVSRAVAALSEKERAVFLAYYFESKTYKEIGIELSMPDRIVGKLNDIAVVSVRKFLAAAR